MNEILLKYLLNWVVIHQCWSRGFGKGLERSFGSREMRGCHRLFLERHLVLWRANVFWRLSLIVVELLYCLEQLSCCTVPFFCRFLLMLYNGAWMFVYDAFWKTGEQFHKCLLLHVVDLQFLRCYWGDDLTNEFRGCEVLMGDVVERCQWVVTWRIRF